jgi:hypothetical protein
VFASAFIAHRGRRILRLDFDGLSEPELLAAFGKVREIVRAEPHRSLLILTRHNSQLTPATAAALKDLTLGNKPHVKASAVCGSSFWKVILVDVQAHGRDDLVLFDDEASALDWLAKQ